MCDCRAEPVLGWGAGKADKGGVQAGEAGLTQRCGQLETALLQGLQQVTLCLCPASALLCCKALSKS